MLTEVYTWMMVKYKSTLILKTYTLTYLGAKGHDACDTQIAQKRN